MDDQKKTNDSNALSGAKLSVSLPSAAKWEEKMAAFRRREQETESGDRRSVCVTVGSEVPLSPYGEEIGRKEKLLRRAARRCMRWYIEPLIERQNRVNRALLDKIGELEEELKRLRASSGENGAEENAEDRK